jgi:uncharacterized membrane protein
MDVDVTVEADIRRPRAEVAAFAMDPRNVPRWYRNIRSVEVLDEGPLHVGSRMAFVARFLGRTISYTYEVNELVPGERLVMSTAQGPFPMTTTYAFADLPTGSTRMTLRNHGSPSGFGAVAAPVMSRAMERATTKDLARLQKLLERGQ